MGQGGVGDAAIMLISFKLGLPFKPAIHRHQTTWLVYEAFE
jgi:hypothetical protein